MPESDTRQRAPQQLSVALVCLMLAQSALGLGVGHAYRDVPWIRATWFGNDAVTLLVAVPLLLTALHLDRRGSPRGRLVWIGMLGYAIYNYAFYLFGASLNAFFPLYVAALVVASTALILLLLTTDTEDLCRRLRPRAPVRVVGGSLTVVGVGLGVTWLSMWAAFVFAGQPTPVDPEVFKLVAALDLSLMVTVLVTGGILLWRRRPWGIVVAALASIQGALYLFVLSVNTLVLIGRGLAEPPGELSIWGPLTLVTSAAAATLIWSMNDAGTALARDDP
jgi:hypothetical protein